MQRGANIPINSHTNWPTLPSRSWSCLTLNHRSKVRTRAARTTRYLWQYFMMLHMRNVCMLFASVVFMDTWFLDTAQRLNLCVSVNILWYNRDRGEYLIEILSASVHYSNRLTCFIVDLLKVITRGM